MKRKQVKTVGLSDTSNSTVLDEGPENLKSQRSRLLEWGLWERLVPEKIADDPASRRIYTNHIRRYETAACYVSGKRVLDIACGAGYGSRMLSLAGASAVVGVDLSAETVEYAKQHYQTSNIQFVCANAEQFECSERFDVVVSFETIEHLHHPEKFLERLRGLLAPDGDLVLSVPLGETRHFDPYHLHSFSQEEVFDLVEKTGFLVEQYRCDDWFLTRSEMLRWGQLYPESKPSLLEFLFSCRGRQLMRDFIRGGFHMPQLLIAAKVSNSSLVEA